MYAEIFSNTSNAVDCRSAWVVSFVDLWEHIEVEYSGKFVVKYLLHIFISDIKIGCLFDNLEDLSIILSGWVFF